MVASTKSPRLGLPLPAGSTVADVAGDITTGFTILDAAVAELQDRDAARDEIIIATDGNGTWKVTDGLGQEIAVTTDNAGTWKIIK